MRVCLVMCCVALGCGTGEDKNKDGIVDGIRSPDSVSQVAPSTPIGSLSGQVLDTKFKGIEGVAVVVTIGGIKDADDVEYKATTDGDGNYAVRGLPAAATALVTLKKTGYATARATVLVPGAAGNFPLNNGNGNVGAILLTELTGSLKLQIVTAGGKPAAGASGTVEVTPAAVRYDDTTGTYGTGAGVVVVTGTADADGVLELKDVPAFADQQRLDGKYSVSIAALDENGDMRTDYLGVRKDFTARELFLDSASRVITLPSAHAATDLKVIASNVDSMVNGVGAPLKNLVKAGDNLFFVFDQVVIESSISVKVTDEAGTTAIAATRMLLKGGNILQVTLMAPAEVAKEYNIALRATSADNGSTFAKSAYFFGGEATSTKAFMIEKITYKRTSMAMGAQLQTGDRVIITFNQPVKASAQAVEVLIDAELNGTLVRGDTQGEKSAPNAANPNTNGFVTASAEPTAEPGSTFASLASGYTTRHEFIYTGMNGVPINTSFVLTFSEIPSTLGGYQTLWGTGIEGDATGVLTAP